MVLVICIDFVNLGYDYYVVKVFGFFLFVEKILFYGVGCLGGLVVLRIVVNFCLGYSMRGLFVRILVVMLEIFMMLVCLELEFIYSN